MHKKMTMATIILSLILTITRQILDIGYLHKKLLTLCPGSTAFPRHNQCFVNDVCLLVFVNSFVDNVFLSS